MEDGDLVSAKDYDALRDRVAGLLDDLADARSDEATVEAERDALNETVRALRDGKDAPHYCAYCMTNVPPTAMIAHMANCEKHPAAMLSGQLVEANERMATLEAELLLYKNAEKAELQLFGKPVVEIAADQAECITELEVERDELARRLGAYQGTGEVYAKGCDGCEHDMTLWKCSHLVPHPSNDAATQERSETDGE